MKPPRSPMLHRCSISPGKAATSASVTPGTSAEEMSSYAPTTRSMRVTGRDDQKFAPRSERRATRRISERGSGGDSEGAMPLHVREHGRDVVGEDDEQIAGLEAAQRLPHRGELVADVLDAVLRHPPLDEPLAYQPGALAFGAAAQVGVLLDDHRVQVGGQPPHLAHVVV